MSGVGAGRFASYDCDHDAAGLWLLLWSIFPSWAVGAATIKGETGHTLRLNDGTATLGELRVEADKESSEMVASDDGDEISRIACA